MIEIEHFNFVMGTTTKPRLMEKTLIIILISASQEYLRRFAQFNSSMSEIKWFNFAMGTTTKPRLMEKLFRCCSRLDEPGLVRERQQQGAGIQKCFYQEEQRTGETMRYDVARGWLPNMIALGNDHNVASGGWLPKMIISRNGLGRDDSLPKNSTPTPPPTCQRWNKT